MPEVFPIMNGLGKPKEHIPWAAIAPHEEQAMRNHTQTLSRLAERGGLGWSEALAILYDEPWHKGFMVNSKERVITLLKKRGYL